MTKQQIFNKIAKFLLAQKKPAYVGYTCKYTIKRKSGDLHCAIGCILPKKILDKIEEKDINGNINELIKHEYIKLPVYFKENKQFLHELQVAHDMPCGIGKPWLATWKSNMLEIAKSYKLNTNVFGE